MSNLYADRVYSEHPIAVWGLDDPVNYISLITEANRELDSWTLDNVTASEYTSVVDGTMFPDSYITEVYPTDINDFTMTLTSAELWVPGDLVADVPVAASVFIYVPAGSISYVDLGSTDGVDEDYTRNVFPESISNAWTKVSTSNMQYDQVFIRIVFKDDFTTDQATYLINGLTVGQYSEPTSSSSLGVAMTTGEVVTPPTTLTNPDSTAEVIVPSSASFKTYETMSVGIKERPAYYVVEDNLPLAYNAGIPLAYGSPHMTRIRPSATSPSLVFDGCGFLNELGRFDTYTVEFWLRLHNTVTQDTKIFGPVTTDDGLYIRESIITLSVGNSFVSHNVGHMTDPMLVHIRYSENFAGLVINGDEVASINLSSSSLTLPPLTQDWLGFWSTSELGEYDIDVFSVFGYLVPTIVAKRRFVWGQGVGEIGSLNDSYIGKTAYADFSSANFTANVSYPDNATWPQGRYRNLDTRNSRLSVPEILLPEKLFSSLTQEEWEADMAQYCTDNSILSFSVIPNANWDNENLTIRFDSLTNYSPDLAGIIIQWKVPANVGSAYTYANFNTMFSGSTYGEAAVSLYEDYVTYGSFVVGGPAPLFLIRQKSNPQRYVYGYTNTTSFSIGFYNGENEVATLYDDSISVDTRYVTYINFNSVFNAFDSLPIPADMAQALYNRDDVELIIGGNGDFNFDGDIFSVSFVSTQEQTNVSASFDTTAFAVNEQRSLMSDTQFVDLSTYTWMPKYQYGSWYEDVGIRGTWEDYIPASALAGTVTNEQDEQVLGLDLLQMNIGYPKPSQVSGDDIVTDDAFVHWYVSWQKSSLTLKTREEMAAPIAPTTLNTIYTETVDYLNAQFEVVDGTTIVPPRDRRPDQLTLAMYVDFAVPGIRTYPVSVKSLEVASLATNRNKFTALGTKYGKDIYPINYNGSYYDKQANNPFRINKRGYPYLYLGKESGFVPDGVRQDGWDRGFQVVIPEGTNTEYALDSIQLWVRRNDLFPETPLKMFELIYTENDPWLFGPDKVVFMLESYQDDRTRGIIKAYDQDGALYSLLSFFQNGDLVANPVLSVDEWAALQISFKPNPGDADPAQGLVIGGVPGRLNIYPGFVYNNISYFAARQVLGSSIVVMSTWTDIASALWTDVAAETWSEVLFASPVPVKSKELSQILFKTYLGIEAVSTESLSPLLASQDNISIIDGIHWSSSVLIPS